MPVESELSVSGESKTKGKNSLEKKLRKVFPTTEGNFQVPITLKKLRPIGIVFLRFIASSFA